jgi:hypothetical protein
LLGSEILLAEVVLHLRLGQAAQVHAHFLKGGANALHILALQPGQLLLGGGLLLGSLLCALLCTGRFYDFLEKREGRWGIVLRQPIYEKDRMDPVTPGTAPVLDKVLLEQFPPGYRHLAYLQTRIGYTVKRDMPGLKGPEVEALYARGAAWLQGKSI